MDGLATLGVDFGLVAFVLCVKDERDGFRLFGLALLFLLHVFVGGQHDLQGLRFDHGCTQHEERDQKHVHVHHGSKVHMDRHLLLGAFFLFAAA